MRCTVDKMTAAVYCRSRSRAILSSKGKLLATAGDLCASRRSDSCLYRSLTACRPFTRRNRWVFVRCDESLPEAAGVVVMVARDVALFRMAVGCRRGIHARPAVLPLFHHAA